MKKTVKNLSVLLSVLMILSLASCSAAEGGIAEDGFSNSMSPSYSYGDPGDAKDEGLFENALEDAEQAEDIGSSNAPTFIENPIISTEKNNISTFSADVDTASYTYFRKLVNQGYALDQLKNGSTSFRTEEFINYFRYDCPDPATEKLFGVKTDLITCPWNSSNHILRVTLQAETAAPTAGNNLVFLIDVSGSMRSNDKLPLLQRAFLYLVGSLGENDTVSIVTYSGSEKVVLDGCRGDRDEMIMNAINSLESGGSTNGQAGLTEAYRIAEKHFIDGGNNRIIMASDGDLNVGISSAEELTKFIEEKRDQGVYLSVLGFGTGNYRDANMEAIADNGNGIYYYIDGDTEAEKVLGTDILSTLYTIAEDVKLQIEFNKDLVSEYRLIGYENRILNKEDFEDDTKDAGEVGASHQVTVCYEIKLTDSAYDSDNIFKLAVRYKNPGEPLSLLDEYTYGSEIISSPGEENDDMKFICAVIETAMVLHNSEHLNGTTLDHAIALLDSADLSGNAEKAEFKALLSKIAK